MNPIIRNFWSIFRRFSLAMTLNVVGMAIAFAAFMIIMMQWLYDIRFDAATPHGDRIFRVESVVEGMGETPITSRPAAKLFVQSSPHIEASCLMFAQEIPLFVKVSDGQSESYYKESSLPVTPDITRVFDFEMLEGNPGALEVENQLLIPESLARKWFGRESALGKRVEADGLWLFRDDKAYQVGGVYRDFPRNSTLQNVIYVSAGDYTEGSWQECNFSFFVRLDDPSVASGLVEGFEQYVRQMQLNMDESMTQFKQLHALSELHWVQGLFFDSVPKANRQTSYLIFTIAWVIILIAAINFTNFSTALAPVRIRSINTQRILGSTVGYLRGLLSLETTLLSFFAFLLSILLISLAKSFGIGELLTTDLSFSAYTGLLLGTGFLSLALGALAGLYPAYYMTSFQPAFALKGSFGLSAAGRRLRAILMGVQYVAAFTLIIAALFMLLQSRYTHTLSLGYDKDALLVSDLSPKAKGSLPVLSNRLKGVAGVEEVSFANRVLSGGDNFPHWGREFQGKMIEFNVLISTEDVLKTLGIRPSDGKDFSQGDVRATSGRIIINQTAADLYGLRVGDVVTELEVVGIVPDIKFATLRQGISPMAFFTGKYPDFADTYEYAYIRVKAGSDLYAVRQQVQDALQQFDDTYAFNVRFFDQVLDNAYQSEQKLTTLIVLFSFLAVFISIVGVFGLVVFDSEYRRKEVGIRKVMGATTASILVMYNKTYLRLVGLCFVLAAPLA